MPPVSVAGSSTEHIDNAVSSHLANASEAALATVSLPFRPLAVAVQPR